MTDTLLDEATRRVVGFLDAMDAVADKRRALGMQDQFADMLHGFNDQELRRSDLRALVERVRDAESERDAYKTGEGLANGVAERWTRRCMKARAERDAARGKLDKVRDWAHHIRTTRQRGDIEYNAASDVLAILDDKEG